MRGRIHFNNQVVIDEAFDGGIQRSRIELYGAIRVRCNVLHDRVAVALLIGESDENLKGRCREREEVDWLNSHIYLLQVDL